MVWPKALDQTRETDINAAIRNGQSRRLVLSARIELNRTVDTSVPGALSRRPADNVPVGHPASSCAGNAAHWFAGFPDCRGGNFVLAGGDVNGMHSVEVVIKRPRLLSSERNDKKRAGTRVDNRRSPDSKSPPVAKISEIHRGDACRRIDETVLPY